MKNNVVKKSISKCGMQRRLKQKEFTATDSSFDMVSQSSSNWDSADNHNHSDSQKAIFPRKSDIQFGAVS